jgi:hypothetical protein
VEWNTVILIVWYLAVHIYTVPVLYSLSWLYMLSWQCKLWSYEHLSISGVLSARVIYYICVVASACVVAAVVLACMACNCRAGWGARSTRTFSPLGMGGMQRMQKLVQVPARSPRCPFLALGRVASKQTGKWRPITTQRSLQPCMQLVVLW